MNKEQLKKFIQARLDNPKFDGCYYAPFDKEGLFLVFSNNYNDNNDLDCKIAYNDSDLQCDYMWDWTEPTNKFGDAIGWEATDILECGYSAEDLTDRAFEAYDYIIKCGWKLPEVE